MTSPEPESLLGVDVYPRGKGLIGVAEHLGDHRGTVATLVQLGGPLGAHRSRGPWLGQRRTYGTPLQSL